MRGQIAEVKAHDTNCVGKLELTPLKSDFLPLTCRTEVRQARVGLSRHNYKARVFTGVLLGLLAALPCWAQLEVGNSVSMTLSGDIGVGYNGNYGNTAGSDHSSTVNGDATLNGYYYNPKFVSFYATPVYNRSQANSGDQSITDNTSISAGANIFSGSHFPGSISYSDSLNGSGNFGMPGIAGFTTHGNSRGFGVGWSELVPGFVPVTVQYSQSSSSSSLFGSDGTDTVGTRNFGAFSNYRMAGWFMNARFVDTSTHSDLPAFLTGGGDINAESNSKSFSFSTSHKLPMSGNFSATYAWSDFSGGSSGLTTTGSDQDVTANASFVPTKRVSTSFMATYDTSMAGQIEQQIIGAGSQAQQLNLGSGNYSASFSNFDSLSITKSLSASFVVGQVEQHVYGENVGATHWSAVLNYSFRKPLWGSFLFYGGANDQTSDGVHRGTGLVAGVNFTRQMEGFDVSGSFGYDQNVQTVLATEVTSDYSYLVNARRHITRRLLWSGNFNGFHTGLGQLEGSGSHSEGLGTNLTFKQTYNFGATYNKVSGTALLTPGGLVLAPGQLDPVLTGNQYLLNSGTSYSFSGTANPLNHMVVSGAYTKATSDSIGGGLDSLSNSRIINVFTQYQFRKMSIGGGYTNLQQAIGGSGLPPAEYSNFYIGIQRWFRAF